MTEHERILVLLEAMPYVRNHRGKIMVIKCGGEIARDPEALDALAQDIAVCALMAGIRVVLVHGGGPQVSELSRRLGQEPLLVEGRRVTDADTLELAKMVFGGQIKTNLMAALQRHGVVPIGLSIDALRASKRPVREVTNRVTGERQQVDYGYVGDITEVDAAMLTHQLEGQFIPVISPLASDGNGGVLNINADTVAAEVAVRMRAAKLIIMMEPLGLLADPRQPTSVIKEQGINQIVELLRGGTIHGGMVPKLEAVVAAVRSGVPRAHLLSGKTPHSLLLELFTVGGVGTMVFDQPEARSASEPTAPVTGCGEPAA